MATLGYTAQTQDTTDSNSDAGIAVSGSAVATNAAGGKVGGAHVFMKGMTVGGTGTQQKTRCVIFKADGAAGAPGTLVGVTNEVIVTTQVDQTIDYTNWSSFGSAPILAGSTNYWVGMWWGTQDGTRVANIWCQNATTFNLYYNLTTTYSTSGNPTVSGGWTANGVSVLYDLYFDYTPLGGPTMWLRA
jgi:hypothetical protein